MSRKMEENSRIAHPQRLSFTIAISGRSSSGKSTIAYLLAEIFENISVPETCELFFSFYCCPLFITTLGNRCLHIGISPQYLAFRGRVNSTQSTRSFFHTLSLGNTITQVDKASYALAELLPCSDADAIEAIHGDQFFLPKPLGSTTTFTSSSSVTEQAFCASSIAKDEIGQYTISPSLDGRAGTGYMLSLSEFVEEILSGNAREANGGERGVGKCLQTLMHRLGGESEGKLGIWPRVVVVEGFLLFSDLGGVEAEALPQVRDESGRVGEVFQGLLAELGYLKNELAKVGIDDIDCSRRITEKEDEIWAINGVVKRNIMVCPPPPFPFSPTPIPSIYCITLS